MSLTVTKFMWKQAYCDSKASLSFCASGSVLLLQGYIENVIYWYSSTHCMIVHPQKCYGELRWVLRPPKYRRNYLACKMQEHSACNNGDSACNFISIQNIQEFCGVLDVQNPKPKSTPGSSTIWSSKSSIWHITLSDTKKYSDCGWTACIQLYTHRTPVWD